MTAADYQATHGRGASTASANGPAKPTTPTPASQPQPAPPHRDAGYGVVEPTDGRGLRFVAWACSEACAVELCAVARKHGHRPTDTSSFLKESKPH